MCKLELEMKIVEGIATHNDKKFLFCFSKEAAANLFGQFRAAFWPLSVFFVSL